MDKIYLKISPEFIQTAQAVRNYLRVKGGNADIVTNDNEFASRKHLYKNSIELTDVDCVDTTIFKPFSGERKLDTFYYGNFNGYKLTTLCNNNIHIYYINRWPIHNFINTISSLSDLSFLANTYKNFEWFEDDSKWIYQSLLYTGCQPKKVYDIKILTVDDYVKDFSL